MWYLIIDKHSTRHFIKEKKNDEYYFITEKLDEIKFKSLKELQEEGFRIIGEAFINENEKLDVLIHSKGGINE